MQLDYVSLTDERFRIGIKPADWDRPAINGNSLGLFFHAHSDDGRPPSFDIVLLHDSHCIGRTTISRREPEVLAGLCPESAHRSIYGHCYINRLALGPSGVISVMAATDGDVRQVGLIFFEGNHSVGDLSPRAFGTAPILVTSLGRSGSTVLADSLGQHPQIGNVGRYPFEYRFFSYCLQAIQVLTSPANHLYSMGGDSFEVRHPFTIGFNPFNHRDYDRLLVGEGVRNYFEGRHVTETIEFCVARAREFVAIVLNRNETAFVEKMAGFPLANLALRLFSDAREVILIRDFWDMIASMLAFDAKRGTSSFVTGDANAWLEGMAFQHANLAYRATLPGRIPIRYETLISEPDAELDRLATSLGLPTNSSVVANMAEAVRSHRYRAVHATGAKGKDARARFSSRSVKLAEELIEARLGSGYLQSGMQKPTRPPRSPNGASRPRAGANTSGRFNEQCLAAGSRTLVESLEHLHAAAVTAREAQSAAEREASSLIEAATQRAQRAETYNTSLADNCRRLQAACRAERMAWKREESDALRQLAALLERAERAEGFSRALLDQEGRLREECGALRAALESERQNAIEQLEAMRDRAERAETYNRWLLQDREQQPPEKAPLPSKSSTATPST